MNPNDKFWCNFWLMVFATAITITITLCHYFTTKSERMIKAGYTLKPAMMQNGTEWVKEETK